MTLEQKSDLDIKIDQAVGLLNMALNDNDVSAIEFFRDKAAKLIGERKLADFGITVVR